jgi:predicted ATPase
MFDKKISLSPDSFHTFGELLRYLRHRAAITQRELALQVGYHYSYLSRIERNERFPDAQMILARFVPALQLEDQPEWAARLVALATIGQGEPPPTGAVTATQTTTSTAVPAERLPAPAPVASMAALPSDLPHPLTSLLGREHEVAILRQLLSDPDIRLLTLTGPPGIGKTRLALQTAAEVAPLFADGVLFVDLSGVRDPHLFVPAMLQALNLPETAGYLAENALLQALHGCNQLLVLDNFEQIIAAAPVVSRLLRHAPSLKALVASREILRLNGENEFAVPPLPTEPELGAPAVRLFSQRAQAAQPGWRPTAANEPVVAELCRRLDGLPLAIELAAARIKLFTPEMMLARLDKRLGWLTGGKRDEQSWRQTMRGAIDWSYQLLTEGEKQLWVGLSVFQGGGTLTAVEQVCNGDWETLATLAEKNLISLRPAASAEEELQFSWLESLREFAAERLAGDPVLYGRLSQAHAQFFQQLAIQSGELRMQGNSAAWLQRLDEAYNNIRAALTWSVAERQGEIALSLCAGLVDYWEIRGHFEEGRFWLAGAAALASEEPSTLLAQVWEGRARLAMRQNDFAEGNALYRQSIALWQELGDDMARAKALLDLGMVLANENGRDLSLNSYFEEALAIYQQLGYVRGIANAFNQLGLTAYYLGDFAAARDYFQLTLEQRRLLGDPLILTGALNNLGLANYALGDYAAARDYHREALRLRQEFGFEGNMSQSRTNLALALIHLGEIEAAETLALASLQAALRLKMKFSVVEVCEALAMIAAHRGDAGRAACLFSAATAQRETHDAPRDPAQERDFTWGRKLLGSAVTGEIWQGQWLAGSRLTWEELAEVGLGQSESKH